MPGGWVSGGSDSALQAAVDALGATGSVPIARLKLQTIAEQLEEWSESINGLPTNADLMFALTRIKEIAGATPEPSAA